VQKVSSITQPRSTTKKYLQKNPNGIRLPLKHRRALSRNGLKAMSEKEYPVQIDETELANRFDPLSYEVLRNAATERPFTGEYTDTDKVGVYKCKACSAELFEKRN